MIGDAMLAFRLNLKFFTDLQLFESLNIWLWNRDIDKLRFIMHLKQILNFMDPVIQIIHF